ncbi:Sensor histidine kinase RcsC [Candidatus Lokiarchaeum ossiferum]|uniref:Sensor histidine kinase RcsC n=1 Tax=Candidatus Lokiarchaeum ossiferum TaxID=2951803 RepID=A0ABY6HT26_9ARCH|nr:Sensor histidine kinase RcsC [Candidatus Lokiarchaeum sp. B-35]
MDFELRQLFNIPKLQSLADKMYMATGIPFALIDVNGELLVGSGWQPICVNFHRQNLQTEQQCLNSDRSIKSRLASKEKYVIFECPMGLIDCATPLIIEGQHLANVFTGQLLFKKPDESFFMKQAQKYGYNLERYMEALHNVPIFTKDQVIRNLEYLVDFTKQIAQMGIQNWQISLSQKKFQDLVEILPYAIWIATPQNDIEYINPAFTNLFGYTLEDISTIDKWFTLAYPDPIFRQQVRPYYDRDLQAGLPIVENPRIFQVNTKDHQKKTIAFRLVLLEDGKFFSLFEDITDRERQETEKIRAQKIESLSFLAGGIAHDFNNLLTGIMGNINLLQIDDTNPSNLDILNDLKQATERASDLTKQILTFSKGGAPIQKIQQIVPLLHNSINLITRGGEAKVIVDIEPDLPNVNVDAGQIGQVFDNILINAIQAMPSGGEISIKTELLHHDEFYEYPIPAEKYIKITISDTGEGIPEQLQQNIFQPYFSTKSKGNGLGLATAYSIIRKHNGFLTFNSFPRQGTQFLIFIPTISSELSLITSEASELSFHECKVLIMDDEHLVRKTLKKMLNKLGCTVEMAKDGEEALQKFQDHENQSSPFDVVFLDLIVPEGMGGELTVKLLKKQKPSVKVVVSSGFSQDPILANYKEYGFDGRLNKPYHIEDLQKIIQEMNSKK